MSERFERICCIGNACIDASETAVLDIQEDLLLGYGVRNGSKAETYLKLHDGARLVVYHTFKVSFSSSIEVFPNAVLELGKSYLNSGCVISCQNHIIIGNNVTIARNVAIYDGDAHKLYDLSDKRINPNAAIIIEDHVWIGFGAIILKGVRLGAGCVIGAGAVVTHDVPPHCIAVGNPARVIREEVQWK